MKYPVMAVCLKTEGGDAEVFGEFTPPELYFALHLHAPRGDGDAVITENAINISKSEGILEGAFIECKSTEMFSRIKSHSPFSINECYENDRSMPKQFSEFDLPEELLKKSRKISTAAVKEVPKSAPKK